MLGRLSSHEGVASLLVTSVTLDDVFALGVASSGCRGLCQVALHTLDLPAVSSLGGSPVDALRRLCQSSLTDHGASIRNLSAAFCRQVDNEVLKALPMLPHLQCINLDGCQDIDDEGLVALAQRCTGLRSISLYWNVKVTDRGLCKLLRAQAHGDLHHLAFSGCKHLSDETVQRLVSRAPNADFLDLTRCNKVTDAGALLICGCLERLSVLRFYAMAQLSPQAFIQLPRLRSLEELDLCGCRIEDEALVAALEATTPSRLTILNLTWCPALTDASAAAVARCCPALAWLSLFGNMNITAPAIEALAAAPCSRTLRSLDLRGLTKAAPYAADTASLRKLFPAVTCTELHH